jgi:hypothetical protein
MLRSLWQAYWLLLPLVAKNNSDDLSLSSVSRLINSERTLSLRAQMDQLSTSLKALGSKFDSFMEELEVSGWENDKITLKTPNAPMIINS